MSATLDPRSVWRVGVFDALQWRVGDSESFHCYRVESQYSRASRCRVKRFRHCPSNLETVESAMPIFTTDDRQRRAFRDCVEDLVFCARHSPKLDDRELSSIDLAMVRFF